MWNEDIFQVVNGLIQQLDYSNNTQFMENIKTSFPNLEFTDFTLFNYLDTVDTLVMIMNKGEEIRKKLLCKSYHYGAVACGFNNENQTVVKIILAHEK